MSKTRIKISIRKTVMTDPLRQFLTDPLDPAEKFDALKQTPITYPLEQAVRTDPSGQSVMTDPLRQVVKTDTSGQAVKIYPSGQAVKTDPSGQAVKTDPSGQAVKTDPSGQAVKIYPSGLAGYNDPSEKSGKTDPSGQAVKTDPSGHAVNSDPLGQIKMTKTLGKASYIDLKTNCTEEIGNLEADRQYLTKTPVTEAKSTDFNESSNRLTMKPTKFKSIHYTGRNDLNRDFVKLKLSNFLDIQQLLNIGYRNPELLPLVKRISVINDIFVNFNFRVQNELVSIIKIVEKTIKEFVYMKQTAYNSDAMQDVVYKLLPKLSKRFCGVVLKQGSFILDPAMRNLVEWNKISKNLLKKNIILNSSNTLFDLSFHFQTKDLVKIGNDHPEFRTNIKTILGVNAAMKHLNHDGQVEIYKILRRMEKIIKDLVQQKTNPDGCQDIFLTTETLTSGLDYCIEKILMHLKASPKISVKCFQCDLDRSYARYIDIEPNTRTHTRPQLEVYQQMSVFDCANWGVSHDRITNLESLIHHLVAKESVLEDVWAFRNCIDWSEIGFLYSNYRSETIQDVLKTETSRIHILRTLEKVDKLLVGAKYFCDEMAHVKFTNNESLSDVLALGGQIETLASEVEKYLKKIISLTRNLFGLLDEYRVVSMKLRDTRILFLTKSQWNAFNFPF